MRDIRHSASPRTITGTRPATGTAQPDDRYWDPEEIQALIREAYARGIDPATLIKARQTAADELRPAA